MTPAIFGLSGTVLTPDERAFFREADPAGYILFGRNVESRGQLARADRRAARHPRARPLLVSIDQEGGRVARMKPPEWQAYPCGEAFAELWQVAPPARSRRRGPMPRRWARPCRSGHHGRLCPAARRAADGAHDVIGDRALGSEPLRSPRSGARARRAGAGRGDRLHQAHARPRPRHGRQPQGTARGRSERGGAGDRPRAFPHAQPTAPIGMTAHVLYTAWDADNPATLSPRSSVDDHPQAHRLRRPAADRRYRHGGARRDRSRTRARAIAAGCDVVLNCWAKMDDMAGIAGAPAGNGRDDARSGWMRALRRPTGRMRRANRTARHPRRIAGAGVHPA
jgi:beta-N-acetylhexosaminidase